MCCYYNRWDNVLICNIHYIILWEIGQLSDYLEPDNLQNDIAIAFWLMDLLVVKCAKIWLQLPPINNWYNQNLSTLNNI